MSLLKAKQQASSAWWALVVGLQCHCASSPALVPPAVAAERAERSPWPGIAALSAPQQPEECTYSGTQPWLIWQGEGDQLAPVRREARPLAVDPLPFAAPPVLEVGVGSGGTRTLVKVENGWLVAVDRGENGGGLYWVRADTLAVQRLDGSLTDSLRWIGRSEFGILGVAGLCHGDACAQRTSVYEVSPAVEGGWGLRPLALLKGCPAAVSLDPAGTSLVVAAQCGALHRIDADAARDVAVWPTHLGPVQVVVPRSAAGAEAVYHVSFGRVVARFRAGHSEWFAPSECVSVATEPNGRCRCVSAP